VSFPAPSGQQVEGGVSHISRRLERAKSFHELRDEDLLQVLREIIVRLACITT
jgi:hypothetical protein